MRCSMRGSQILQPTMYTSTPISKRRKASALNFFDNSPITISTADQLAVPKQLLKYQNQKKEQITVFKVLGDEKIPLIQEKMGSSFRKSVLSYPPMVVISDSEEEDKPDLYCEVTLPPNTNSSSRRKSIRMDVDQQKENCKSVKNRRNAVRSLKDNLIKTENKKSQKRISRVDTIIDEIMKERKSTVMSPSPLVKMKSGYIVNATVKEEKNDLEIRRVTRSSVLKYQDSETLKGNGKRNRYVPNILKEGRATRNKAEEVIEKLQDIGNLDIKNNITRRSMKSAQCMIKNEKKIQDRIVNNFSDCEDLFFNYQRNQSDSNPTISSRAEQFDKNLPVFYNQEEVCVDEWIQVNGQNGVFVKNNFRMLNVFNGFVKIEAKCSLLLHSGQSQIFNIVEGRGIFVYDNDNMKVKIGPGQTITIPAGFPCKIINSGLKKKFVFNFVKIYSE